MNEIPPSTNLAKENRQICKGGNFNLPPFTKLVISLPIWIKDYLLLSPILMRFFFLLFLPPDVKLPHF